MEFKDIAGIAKLAETVRDFVGDVIKPNLTKRQADATAYAIKQIGDAVDQQQEKGIDVHFNDDTLSIKANQQLREVLANDAGLLKRTLERFLLQETKRQQNREQIAAFALEELKNDERISDEVVDPDWTAHFFNNSQDTSKEQMQAFWGRILAGEVRKPGSFSKRTLDVVTNLSQKEAQLFTKFADLAFSDGPFTFIFNADRGMGTMGYDHYSDFHRFYGLAFADLLLLREIGLLKTEDSLTLTYSYPSDAKTVVRYGNAAIVVSITPEAKERTVPVFFLTTVGQELMTLIDRTFDLAHVQRFAEFLRADGVTVQYATKVDWDAEPPQLINLRDVPVGIPAEPVRSGSDAVKQ